MWNTITAKRSISCKNEPLRCVLFEVFNEDIVIVVRKTGPRRGKQQNRIFLHENYNLFTQFIYVGGTHESISDS